MTTILATFTDPRAAEQAAASLRDRGFDQVSVGPGDAGPSSLLGLGETLDSFKLRVLIGSTLGGALTFAAALGFLGFVAMGFTELRNMGTPDMAPGLLVWAASWAIAGLVLGAIAGLVAGVVLANLLAQATRRAVAEGRGIRRPTLAVNVYDQQAEEMAYSVLREVGPYEIARFAR
ncbi:MAG: hypothetical protein OHK0015_37280 [Chloroflexi bacterium OHK40]